MRRYSNDALLMQVARNRRLGLKKGERKKKDILKKNKKKLYLKKSPRPDSETELY